MTTLKITEVTDIYDKIIEVQKGLKKRRIELGLSIEDMCKILNTDAIEVVGLEDSDFIPSYSTVLLYAYAVGFDLDGLTKLEVKK